MRTISISGKVLSGGTNKDQSKQKSELVHIELIVQKVLMERSTSVFNFYTVWIDSYCQLPLLYIMYISVKQDKIHMYIVHTSRDIHKLHPILGWSEKGLKMGHKR